MPPARKVVLLCLLLAVSRRTAGQGVIAETFPCEDPADDPNPNDPRDNLSCPRLTDELVCYSRAELCNGGIPFCPGGSDEGADLIALDCTRGIFECSPNNPVSASVVCDGVENCPGGDDEITTLCENKCLFPYYGGCPYTRNCETSEFDIGCRFCLQGFAMNPADPFGSCFIEIGLERTTYTGSETDGITEVICAVLLADASDFFGGIEGAFNAIRVDFDLDINTPVVIEGQIASALSNEMNAAQAGDFQIATFDVTLSMDQTRDCVTFTVTDDAVLDPFEIFNVVLTTSSFFANVYESRSSAVVTINDNDELVEAMYVPDSYTVSENAGTARLCVAIIARAAGATTLTGSSTVSPTFLTGGSAASGSDFIASATPSVLSFAAGTPITTNPATSAQECFTFPILNDDLVESIETVQLGLSSPTGLIDPNALDSEATVFIINDDRPIVGFNPVSYTHDEESTADLEVCIQLFSVGDHPDPITFQLSSVENTAQDPMDFMEITDRDLTFPANSVTGSTVCTNVNINNDMVLEMEVELFFLDITSSDADIEAGRGRATVSITETNDQITCSFEQSSYTIAEETGSQVVCVMCSGGTSSQDIDINIVTGASGTATASEDYTPVNAIVTIPAGANRGCVFVPILDDLIVEMDETVPLRASLVVPLFGVSFGVSNAAIIIVDIDRVTVRFVPPAPVVPEYIGVAQVCIEITIGELAPGEDAIVIVSTSSSSARAFDDYTVVTIQLVFDSTNDDQMLCINIPIINDTICEDTEVINIFMTTADPDVTISTPATTVTIIDDDVAQVALTNADPNEFSNGAYIVTECSDEGFYFDISIINGVRKGPDIQCVISVFTEDGSALAGDDYVGLDDTCVLNYDNSDCEFHIEILDDFTAEMNEYYSIILTSSDSTRCNIANDNITIRIIDDEDCDDEDACEAFEMCEELRCPRNFTCTPVGPDIGDDPHFAVTLESGKTLCYTVQGEHGFAFNLISNQKVYMNAMFVPDRDREEVTWLGTMGIVVNNNGYKKSNMTKLRFEAIKNKIHVDDQMVLEARNIEKITIQNGKLTISEAPPVDGYKTPFVRIDLKDVELSFSVKFMTEHLDLYWHSTGQNIADSHGLIGQFFHHDVVLDVVRKILMIPGKEPVPIQRKPVWAFMEREAGDSSNYCWVAMNPGFQGEGLIDGTYFDYLVDDVLSTEFKFRKL